MVSPHRGEAGSCPGNPGRARMIRARRPVQKVPIAVRKAPRISNSRPTDSAEIAGTQRPADQQAQIADARGQETAPVDHQRQQRHRRQRDCQQQVARHAARVIGGQCHGIHQRRGGQDMEPEAGRRPAAQPVRVAHVAPEARSQRHQPEDQRGQRQAGPVPQVEDLGNACRETPEGQHQIDQRKDQNRSGQRDQKRHEGHLNARKYSTSAASIRRAKSRISPWAPSISPKTSRIR